MSRYINKLFIISLSDVKNIKNVYNLNFEEKSLKLIFNDDYSILYNLIPNVKLDFRSHSQFI